MIKWLFNCDDRDAIMFESLRAEADSPFAQFGKEV